MTAGNVAKRSDQIEVEKRLAVLSGHSASLRSRLSYKHPTMKILRLLTVFLLFAVLGCAPKPDETVSEEPDDETEYNELWFGSTPYSEEIQAAAKERLKKIRAEIKSLGKHPWAGKYFDGCYMGGGDLLMAPKSGFLYIGYNCTGIDGLNYGDITQKQDTLHLTSTFPRGEDEEKYHHYHVATEYVLVPWGEACYLVRPCDIIHFCTDLRGIPLPWRRGAPEDYIKEFMNQKENPADLPIPPEQFKLTVQKHPIVVKIVSVGESKTVPDEFGQALEITVTLDKGTRDGVQPGLVFHPEKRGFLDGRLIITSAEATKSEGVYRTMQEKEVVEIIPPGEEQKPVIQRWNPEDIWKPTIQRRNPEEITPQPGWRFTTK